MRQRWLAPLVTIWLLGLFTAFGLWLALSMERRSYVEDARMASPGSEVGALRTLASKGWVVVRTETTGTVSVYYLERPRYLGIVETMKDFTATPTPTPERSAPKPTDSPKPTTAPVPR